MDRKHLVRAAAGVALSFTLIAGCSSSSKSSSSSSSSSTGGGISASSSSVAAGTTVDVTVSDTKGLDGPMTMVVAPASAPAGNVTFKVTNKGTIEHEVVLMKLSAGQTWDKIPVTDAGDPPASVSSGADKVDEANNVAETGDPNLKPGQTRSFTATDLKPGQYALVCNIAKHYGLGMRAAFEVK